MNRAIGSAIDGEKDMEELHETVYEFVETSSSSPPAMNVMSLCLTLTDVIKLILMMITMMTTDETAEPKWNNAFWAFWSFSCKRRCVAATQLLRLDMKK